MKYIAARKWLIGSLLAAIISLPFKYISLHFANEATMGLAARASNEASGKVDRSDNLLRRAELDGQRSGMWGMMGLSFFVAAIVLFVPSVWKNETQRRELPIMLLTAIGIFQLLLTI